ncbi:PH domain-containing protein [Fructobacillus americanaquae]|uniref:PH domain-containing protein n=1 Tax=Fructobacillus americanaquae TaxID=2940302 RepID=A0ABY5C159_9LACO|nr:PH domain-containing protein [Fructobacillus americanaquae]USS92216.1 PH domain-containing protein [Fructobacillus americanaquae]
MKAKHLHPLTFIFDFYEQLKSVVALGLAVLFFFHFTWWEWVLLFLALLLWSLLSFWMKTYELTESELIYRSGILERQVRHLPYHKIQNIHRKQWFFLQPFHLEDIAVDSGGKGAKNNQISLLVVPTWVALVLEQKRQDETAKLAILIEGAKIQAQKEEPATQEQVEQVTDSDRQGQAFASAHNQKTADGKDILRPNGSNRLATDSFRASILSLIVYAVTTPEVIFQFFIFLGGFIHLDQQGIVSHWIEQELTNHVLGLGALVIALLVVAFVFIVVAFNVLRTVILYFGFEVHHDAGQLTIARGLFERQTMHLSINRMQTVEVRQNVFRQLLGLVTVKTRIITDENGEDKVSKNVPTLIPMVKSGAVDQYLSRWLPDFPSRPIKKTDSSTYQILTMIRNGLFWTLPIATVLIYAFRRWPVVALLVLIVLAFVVGTGWYKGQATTAQVVNRQVLVLKTAKNYETITTYIAWDKIQSLSIKQSWWLAHQNRRAHLAVVVRTDANTKVLTARYLPMKEVQSIFDWYQSLS